MPVPVTLEGLDLAALLCSRVCHDLISPVGAVINGIEVIEDDADEQTRTFALELIKKSATTASARLQFCRIAFGAAGSAGASIDTGDAENVARGMMEDDKTKIAWNLPRVLLAKNRVKLLLNMLLLAGGTIPRGGTITVEPIGEGDALSFRIDHGRAQCAHPAGGAGPRRRRQWRRADRRARDPAVLCGAAGAQRRADHHARARGRGDRADGSLVTLIPPPKGLRTIVTEGGEGVWEG